MHGNVSRGQGVENGKLRMRERGEKDHETMLESRKKRKLLESRDEGYRENESNLNDQEERNAGLGGQETGRNHG